MHRAHIVIPLAAIQAITLEVNVLKGQVPCKIKPVVAGSFDSKSHLDVRERLCHVRL